MSIFDWLLRNHFSMMPVKFQSIILKNIVCFHVTRICRLHELLSTYLLTYSIHDYKPSVNTSNKRRSLLKAIPYLTLQRQFEWIRYVIFNFSKCGLMLKIMYYKIMHYVLMYIIWFTKMSHYVPMYVISTFRNGLW